MADFAPNFTDRYKLLYRVQGTPHSFTWRFPIGTTTPERASFVTKLSAFLAALEPQLWADWQVTGATYATGGSDVFLPTASPDQPTGAAGTSGRTLASRVNFAQFVGRGSSGSKVSFYMYGLQLGQDSAAGQDFRILATESAAVSAAIGILTETPPLLVAIDDSPAGWYPYINIKDHDHWVHKNRQGA